MRDGFERHEFIESKIQFLIYIFLSVNKEQQNKIEQFFYEILQLYFSIKK